MPQPIKVRQIDHVTLIVRDLEESRRFYVDGLGMEQTERPAFDFEGMWLQAGNTQVHLILEDENSQSAGAGHVPGSIVTRSHHLAFAVQHAEEAARRLETAGWSLACPLQRRPDGARQAFVSDPDGHLIELCSSG